MIYKPFSPLTLIQNRESVALTTAALSTLPALAIGLFSPWLGLTTPIWALFSVALLTGAIASAVATLLWRLREEFLLECNSGSSKEENVVESSLDAEEPEKRRSCHFSSI